MQLIGKLQLEIIFKTIRWGIAVNFLERWAGGAFNGLCGVKVVEVLSVFCFCFFFFYFEK